MSFPSVSGHKAIGLHMTQRSLKTRQVQLLEQHSGLGAIHTIPVKTNLGDVRITVGDERKNHNDFRI